MRLSDFSYDLPDELIARHPLSERSSSRLLCLQNQQITHRQFTDIVDLIQPNDLLVCNNTRVIPARIFGTKPTGGRVEILIEKILAANRFIAHVRASKAPKPGSEIWIAPATPRNDKDGNQQTSTDCFVAFKFEVIKRHDELFELSSDKNILDILNELGEVPLPPYFQRKPEENDKDRYQTVFAKHNGSVAAPTAGLHFDKNILEKIKNTGADIGYLTLHVGSGTFAPVRVEEIEKHKMHAEFLSLSETLCEKIRATKQKGGRVIAVGTTSARSLETAALSGEIKPFEGETNIFIYPGFQFKCVDALITNFHLPASTLLMLVSAFAGHQNIMQAYREAIREKYRFYSYGDAMFLSNA